MQLKLKVSFASNYKELMDKNEVNCNRKINKTNEKMYAPVLLNL